MTKKVYWVFSGEGEIGSWEKKIATNEVFYAYYRASVAAETAGLALSATSMRRRMERSDQMSRLER